MDTRGRVRRQVVDWQGHANCADCNMPEGASCQDLPSPRWEGMPAPVDKLTYGARSPLYAAGDEAQHIFVIRDGLVKLTQVATNGTRRIVRFLRAGQVAGMEALSGGLYRHTAETILPTAVCRLPMDASPSLLEDEVVLSPRLIKLWQRAVDDADTVITQLSTGSAQGRVARFMLLVLSDDEDNCISLPREDMAALLSITVETISRTVTDFKRQGLLFEDRGRFFFDRENLLPMAKL